jgi:hypothetical protein
LFDALPDYNNNIHFDDEKCKIMLSKGYQIVKIKKLQSTQYKLNELPVDFDPLIYKKLHYYLCHINDPDKLIKHFITFGSNEGRHYKYNQTCVLPYYLREITSKFDFINEAYATPNINLLLNCKHVVKNAVNNLQSLNNICFFVHTLPKTGTTSLSRALQKSVKPNNNLENVCHSHSEACFQHVFRFLDKTFNLFEIINYQIKKPTVFQLYREPISRLISHYLHMLINEKLHYTFDLFETFVNNKIGLCQNVNKQYEHRFDFNMSDLKYDKLNKFLFLEKTNFNLFFTTLEHFDNLKQNLITVSNKIGHNFDNFEINNVNTMTDEYCEIREDILNKLKGKKELVNKIYDVDKTIIDFYYTEEEILNFKNKYML